jgi:hypothetical protein
VKLVAILEHADTFDDEEDEARRLAAHLALLLYRSGDFSMSRERAHEYPTHDASPDPSRAD